MGFMTEDGDEDELSSFLTSDKPMSDEQKARLIDKVGLGAKIGEDESVKAAQGEADSKNKTLGILQGLSTALAGSGKTNAGYYDGLRNQAQSRVKGAEDAFKDRQRVAQYIIGRDDKLRGMQESSAQRKALNDEKLAAEKAAKEDERKWREGENAKDRASRVGKNSEGHKIVAAEVAKSIGQYDTADTLLQDLEKNYAARAASTGSGLKQFIPGTDANLYSNSADLSAQNIGQILEGGKLTDSDYDRYKKMMPSASDTADQAANKFAEIRRQISEKKRGAISGTRQAGYNVSGFNEPEALPSGLDAVAASKKADDGTAIAAPTPKDGDTKPGPGGKTYVRKGGKWYPQ